MSKKPLHNKLYITSTLPYANSNRPHVGHLFEFILTDSLARFFRSELGDNNVFFNTGLDCHGSKIYEKAKEIGIEPNEYVTGLTIDWKRFCELLHIKYDNFYITSELRHHEKSKKLWMLHHGNGDIYKKKYEGKYCVGCESFKTDAELNDGKCQDHPNVEIRKVEEENYFFRISKYKHELKSWIESEPQFLSPQSKLQELINLIDNLDDISVSRLKKNLPWGVEVPNDQDHTMYVWYEALANYIFSCGYYENSEKFNSWWSNVVQTCGPDNLKFQAVIFQAMLCSAGIKKTDKLLVHGTILDEQGRKMSKTLGNVVDPMEQLEKFGLDAVRLYALGGLSTYSDGCWSERELLELYNARFSNGYGNLIARTLHLIDTREANVAAKGSATFREEFIKNVERVKQLWRDYKIREAISLTAELVDEGNKYFNDSKPWEQQNLNFNNELSDIYFLLNEVTELYKPVIPNRYDEIKKCLADRKKTILFPRIELVKKEKQIKNEQESL